jgi:hypothetical protein
MFMVGSVKKGKVEQTTPENARYVIEYGAALPGRHNLRRETNAASLLVTNRGF